MNAPSSPTYSPPSSPRSHARHLTRRDDERDRSPSRDNPPSHVHLPSDGTSEQRGLTLKRMLSKLNEHGPIDVMLHVLVREGEVCPFSTVGINKIKQMSRAIDETGVATLIHKQPLSSLLAHATPCKGHAMGFSLGHLCAHAEALAGASAATGVTDQPHEAGALLHSELNLYLQRRGVAAADVRREKELEKHLKALQDAHDRLAIDAKDAYDRGFERGFAQGLSVGGTNEPNPHADT